MNLHASDIMETAVVTVPADMPLYEVQRLLDREGIHGAPVVAADRVIGVIAAPDLVRALRADHVATAETERRAAQWTDRAVEPDALFSLPPSLGRGELTAADAMDAEVVAVAPSTPVAEVARLMRERGVHRVLVLERGHLRGLVSSTDLLELVADAAAAQVAVPDE